jgi:hypothetical protein
MFLLADENKTLHIKYFSLIFTFVPLIICSHVNIDASMVKIFQMRAPERGQVALPFQPINRNDDDEEDDDAASRT